jgi:hypothetical protein
MLTKIASFAKSFFLEPVQGKPLDMSPGIKTSRVVTAGQAGFNETFVNVRQQLQP